MVTILLSVLVLGVAVLCIAVRMFLVRDGEFRGTCATANPFLRGVAADCWACGKSEEESCEYRSPRS